MTTSGKYGDALDFDGTNDALHLTDLDFAKSDYTIGMWFKSTDSNNQGLLSATDENGLAVYAHINTGGTPRILHRFPGGTSGGTAISAADTYNDGEWHYFTAVKDGTTLTLYIDGEWQGEATGVTTAATAPLNVALGYRLVGGLYHLNGSLDEAVILNEAVDADGVTYLMNSQYPAIKIDQTFTEFELNPLTATTVSGTAAVADYVESGSVHQFTEEVEAAFDLEIDITATTYYHEDDDNSSDGSDLSGYFRFDEIPSSSSFNNQVVYNTFGTTGAAESTVELNATCGGTGCPLSGVRGVAGRALYFDGVDDFLHVDISGDVVELNDGSFDDLLAGKQPQVQAVSVWVKGTQGTIFNRGVSANSAQFQIDHGRVSYLSSFDDFVTADFDMPVNEWTHLVVSLDDDGRIRTWIDGELVVDVHTYDNAAVTSKGNWLVGANYGTQNHFEGFIDELYLYEVELDDDDVQALYTTSVPTMRFEFDEAAEETIFVDSINGYVAEPVSVECVDVALETLTVQQLDETLTNLVLEVDGDVVSYKSVDDFGAVVTDTTAVSLTLNISTPICADSTITAKGVYSDGTEITFSGSASSTVAETATADALFTSGAQQLTLAHSTGAIYNLTTPIAGTDGRIGNTVYFPSYGDGYLEIANSEGLGDFATDDFTFMTWLLIDDASNTPIWTKDNRDDDNDDGEKLFIIGGNGTPRFISRDSGSSVSIKSTESVTDSIWHHVAVTWDYDGTGSSGSYAIYVDGVDVTDSANSDYSASQADNSTDSWTIGRRGTGSEGYRYFDGELDEFAVYLGRAMTSTLIYETYLQEARWYRDRARFSVLVDDDVPTMTVQTTRVYIDQGYAQQVITPSDPTSGIALVQFGVKGPSDSSYAWDTAELCSDSGVVYCPTFFTDDEGTYEVIYRIVDSVGNEMTSDVHEYFVDLTPPVLSASASLAVDPLRVASVPNFDSRIAAESISLSVAISQTSVTSWLATFGGSVSDPDIESGVEGSGIDEDAFFVTVYNSAWAIVGSPQQVATVDEDNGTWTIDYLMTGLPPAGTYTVKVYAQDEKGNQTLQEVGTFTADEQAPRVTFHQALWPERIISSTHVISGVVSDQPYWALPQLMFHFEENSDATSFYTSGSNPQLLDCSGGCPQTAAAGAFGRGLDFDGTTGWALDAAVISDSVNFDAADAFTIAFWMQADYPQANLGQVTNSLIEKRGDGSSYPYSIRYNNQTGSDQGKITASRSDGTNSTVISSTSNLSDSAFHHVALVKGGDELTLYIDGRAEMTVTDVVSNTTTNDDSFAIGHRPDNAAYNFSGVIDELLVYDTPLVAAQIYALAQDGVSGSNSVEIAFEQIDFASYPDFLTINERQGDVTWQAAALDQPNGLGSAWNYTMSDMESWVYIHIRGQDGNGNETPAQTVWHGLIDHVAPTGTVTGQQVGYGTLPETVYTFTFSDFLLDMSTLTSPCSEFDLSVLAYDDANLPYDSMPYQVSGTCTAAGWQSNATFEICDSVGHCTEELVTPSASTDLGAIQIVTPTVVLTSTTSGTAVEIAGAAVASNGIQTVTVAVNGVTIETISYDGSITETTWSTLSWTPTVTDQVTITASIIDVGGMSYNDTLSLELSELISSDTLTVHSLNVDGGDLLFDWSATGSLAGCDVYVYRTTADPYGTYTQWVQLTTSPQSVTPPADEMAYYYLGAPACGDGSAVSEKIGVFQFGLTAGE